MPLSADGSKAMASMVEEYGEKKGKQVFYATMNKKKMAGKWEHKKTYSKEAIEMAKRMKR